jgi:carboxylesterase type B
MFRDLDSWKWQMNRDTAWAAVNVSQPLKNLDLIPDDIPIIIGANKHEGEMFVHGAFPITMSKAVYWMFVGALFRDSASRVLRHYRGYVDQIEREAQELARLQIEEEENRQYYLENREQLEKEYQMLLDMNVSSTDDVTDRPGIEEFVATWSRGGSIVSDLGNSSRTFFSRLWPFPSNSTSLSDEERSRIRDERRKVRAKEKALREAAKVVVDYRPVMSRIIDDYLFRCPAWHFAHKVSQIRLRKGHPNNVYVYQFSHSTHIPGFKECWGKACHTAEIPYAFEAMDIIRANYSTLSPIAQTEAPQSPEYPYTDFLAAYREALQAADRDDAEEPEDMGDHNYTQSTNFQRILDHFFGDYFKEDPDEDIANDMGNRWYAFARNGDPNYSESKAKWRPWRYALEEQQRDNQRFEKDFHKIGKEFDLDHIFSLENIQDDEWDNSTKTEGFSWSGAFEERVFRRRVLDELGMEVAAEDVFQTMLRRKVKPGEEQDYSFNSLLFGSVTGPKSRQGSREQQRRRQALRQLVQIAQDMKIMGTGLQGDHRRGQTAGSWEDDFFPQILELKWPPEDRLVERDCTCDMWDRIRCKYIYVARCYLSSGLTTHSFTSLRPRPILIMEAL